MAFTYSKLAEVTVGSGGASTIDFNNIPQNYNDLIVKVSARSTSTGIGLVLRANGTTTSVSTRHVEGSGSAVASYTSTNIVSYMVPSTATASTFGNTEIYIPNYAGSSFKSISSDSVNENNATSAFSVLTAWLWSNVSAITSFSLANDGAGNNFAQYSTATLYGVKAEV
jgi:hypothetical protein